MRSFVLAIFLSATSATAAFSQTAKCDEPETIVIEAGQELKFPTGFMVTSLMGTIDPNGSTTHHGVAWNGNWFSIDNFKGPFFIMPGQSLLPRKPENDRGIVISGYKCH
jgi:hypothetical protein